MWRNWEHPASVCLARHNYGSLLLGEKNRGFPGNKFRPWQSCL